MADCRFRFTEAADVSSLRKQMTEDVLLATRACIPKQTTKMY